MKSTDLKVAIVHDDFIQHGGAERLALAMTEIWPRADLFAVTASASWKTESRKEIKTTWVQELPFKQKLFRYYYSFYPLAVESFNFDGYDLVVSSSARYAHGVITKPETVHVAYVNSPARFIWQDGLAPRGFVPRQIIGWHKNWDRVASTRPDYVIANSKTPALRMEKYWKRKPDTIIYPFIDLSLFAPPSAASAKAGTGDYFLTVSRLSKWKRIDLAVEACRDLGLTLKVVGAGEDMARLKSLAGPTVKFLGSVSDAELVVLYRNCQALIMTQEEDFGMAALEAQACGRPVVAYGAGGARETVKEGVTGLFFDEQEKESVKGVLSRFDPKQFLGENCSTSAAQFGSDRFKTELLQFCEDALQNH